MVSDSEMTECQFHNNCGGWCETRRELEHNLCEHCLESHDEEMSEPATPYGWHVEWADSGDHYLFTKVEKRIESLRLDSDVKVVQLYTHADTGEVERLSKALTLLLTTGASAQDNVIDIEHDSQRGVTCYILNGAGISCIPDSQLQAGNQRQLSPHETQPEPTPALAPGRWIDERYQL
jgi:hypothetical protein